VATEATAAPFRSRSGTEHSTPFRIASVVLVLGVVPLAVLAAFKPLTAALLLVGLVVVGFCVIRIEAALMLVIVSAPLEGLTDIGAETHFTPTKLAGAICFASFILYTLTSRRRLRFDQSHVIVVGLLAIAIVSTLQAQEISSALATTLRYAAFVALYVVVSQFVGEQAMQRRLVWALSIASSIAAFEALRNFASGETALANLDHSDPNDIAYILATTLPLTFWLLRERWLLRPVVLLMIGLIAAAVLLSFSRGAVVGLGAAAVWHMLTERRHIKALALGVAVVGVATFIFVNSNPRQVESGFQAKQNVASENVEMRLDAWGAALRLTEDHPLLGVGPGNFQYLYPEVTDRPPGVQSVGVVHNAYLDVGAELGVLAMALFLAYVAIAFARATAAHREGKGIPGYAAAVRTALVVAVVGAFFLSEQYFLPLWLLGGLATMLWLEGRDPDDVRPPAPTAREQTAPA
jgi:putative inorganic carbon (HCO3(-)) transporter